MKILFRHLLTVLFTLAIALCGSRALAVDAGPDSPCGRFDFSAGLDCKIELSGGCTANCTPFKFEAACTGGCTTTVVDAGADSGCVDKCGTECIKQCNPAALDCFVGCHSECDEPTIALCKKDHPNDDCVSTSQAQCDIHCKESCKIKPSSCDEHCTKCCSGSCTTQVNHSCDYKCFADVKGGCDVHCAKPEGAIFCNGQYVNASNVESCVSYLATQGLKVDLSARASATCDVSGCKGVGDVKVSVPNVPSVPGSKGCATTDGASSGLGLVGVAVFAMTAAFVRGRRRRK